MKTITVVASKSKSTSTKPNEVTINLEHLIALEKASNNSSIVTLSTGKSFPVTDEYNFLYKQLEKANCNFIEVNKILTFPSKDAHLKTAKLAILLEKIVSFEETNLSCNPFRADLAEPGTIISLSTGTNITATNKLESILNYIAEK